MPYYEYMVITRQNFLQDNKPNDLLKKMSGMLAGHGKIIKHEYWGLRNFNYVIKRKRRGHYVLMYIDATNADIINEIQRKMSIDDNILRYLVTKIDKIPNFVSPMNLDEAINDVEADSSKTDSAIETTEQSKTQDKINKATD
ncbi:small subunit ribosomal protein S6 [Candidatus Xenohaliotis californiensis]|uniref:Small ribosomal subunit protein bS6 n=1 Tax=Candidatus Xenohaliotis californiensis TaxID=84677 RepID=A0ABM9N8Y6_9RICK|nr:small subunit ribosomal protein S6 [Candidatus Xenohaliotis californiensis]